MGLLTPTVKVIVSVAFKVNLLFVETGLAYAGGKSWMICANQSGFEQFKRWNGKPAVNKPYHCIF